VDEKTLSFEIQQISKKIRNLISPLMIRRSRLDLDKIVEYREDLKAQGISFPEVSDPILEEYELEDLSELYLETLKRIAPEDEDKKEGFIGARYKPVTYLKNFKKYQKQITEEFGDVRFFKQSQMNMAIFMRRHLVRRFESSMRAFRISLERMIKSTQTVLNWYEQMNMIPIYKEGNIPDIDDILEDGTILGEEIEENRLKFDLEELKEKGYIFIESNEIRKAFKEDLLKDINLLKEIYEKWFGDGIPKDPKVEHFVEIILRELKKDPNRKIVVFTEFVDTANYLYEKLNNKLRILKYTGSDSTKLKKDLVRKEFDASVDNPGYDYDLLIATDALSEGFNLNRAGTVFNYDIPYNPTRVIQRVGRINRVNKKVFDKLYIYNFFPTETGEAEISIKKISTLKFAMINAILGEDTKILTSDEELKTFFRKQYSEAAKQQEELSWDVKYKNVLNNAKRIHPDLVKQAISIPHRSRIRRTAFKDKNGVIIFGKKGSNYVFKFADNKDSAITLSDQEALELFEADIYEEPEKVSKSFEEIYQSLKDKLFKRTELNVLPKGQREAVNRIKLLKDKCPTEKDYLDDVETIISKYNALPERYEKQIRNAEISDEKAKYSVEQLKKEIPHSYIESIINRANKIEEQAETIILSEEFCNNGDDN
jgi:superfamily II DNA/RNA helicase